MHVCGGRGGGSTGYWAEGWKGALGQRGEGTERYKEACAWGRGDGGWTCMLPCHVRTPCASHRRPSPLYAFRFLSHATPLASPCFQPQAVLPPGSGEPPDDSMTFLEGDDWMAGGGLPWMAYTWPAAPPSGKAPYAWVKAFCGAE